jgi:hypothetical protein
MSAGIIVSQISNGNVFCGSNTVIGCGTIGVTGGISATLGAGWGTTASVTSIMTTGDAFRIAILPGGTGLANFAIVNVSTPVSSLTQPPMMNVKAVDANGTVQPVIQDTSITAASMSLAYGIVPVAGLAVTMTGVG